MHRVTLLTGRTPFLMLIGLDTVQRYTAAMETTRRLFANRWAHRIRSHIGRTSIIDGAAGSTSDNKAMYSSMKSFSPCRY